MCLQVYAVPTIANRVSAERLSRVSGLRVKKVSRPVKGAFWFSRDGGCSCSLMADNADWGGPGLGIGAGHPRRVGFGTAAIRARSERFYIPLLVAGR